MPGLEKIMIKKIKNQSDFLFKSDFLI